MARWKALPEELDPQIGEFTRQLRRLVDQGGLSAAALADRTGYSRTSWERYLNGRLLAPRGAVVALAEVTGTSPVHLATLWELAERAWSRAESRHDRTMEQIRITHARAELGDLGGGTGTATADAPPVSPSSAESLSSAEPPPSAEPPAGKRRVLFFLAGAVAVLVVLGTVFLLTGRGDGEGAGQAAGSPSPSATGAAGLPPGVKCVGVGCTGKDAEAMGCGGDLVTTAGTATVGAATLEVRYSRTCGAAWGRITGARPGDRVRVTADGETRRGAAVAGETYTYTPMVAVGRAGEAEACVSLVSGRTGCTR
ncbi:transcriptional regulator with XRE-family HTH domain [Streptomyces sp. BK022]|uniref:XRE family transcriptional regulator n=1 Tax=Streptomyces sp. BK022 TaxID=2512123 RepID=UPI0010293F58|nr:XRE family transcriptional regulator [Streptomyces sp. BK022]RZU44044.1 transcriptional regulator with XRE-family HTH domain [Streptomyces sp. BK022]